jgi:hypothetical protein
MDSGEHAEILSYALTGLSRFNKEQLDYVLQLDLFDEGNSSDPDDPEWKPKYLYKHCITNRKPDVCRSSLVGYSKIHH